MFISFITPTTHRTPTHPLLDSFVRHMAQGGQGHWESPLGSLPRLPNHNVCEIGELTQTGKHDVIVQTVPYIHLNMKLCFTVMMSQ